MVVAWLAVVVLAGWLAVLLIIDVFVAFGWIFSGAIFSRTWRNPPQTTTQQLRLAKFPSASSAKREREKIAGQKIHRH